MIVEAADKTSLEFIGSKTIYMNRVDGVEHEGFKIEQDLDVGKYSEFLDSSSCVLRTGDGKVQLGECDAMITTHRQGVLLDMLNNKMYIHGRKLTSEDLHSQTATVDILKILIENI